jgi:catechol 2,3-dioxygenase-like lactoylglutathione lyase family enzyme
MKPAGIDHVVLTVRDLEASAVFYTRVLNMERRIFGEGRVALHAGRFKLNLHQAGDEGILLVAESVKPGSLDICFVTKASPDETMAHLRREGIDIIAGPVIRSGARGSMTSLYFRDPDGNLIEVSSYPSDGQLEIPGSHEDRREQTMQPRRVNVFFYGSYIDEGVLSEHGFEPDDVRLAELRGYDVRIDPLTRLVQDADHSVFGILCRATHAELDALYASPWMKAYLPEPIIVTLADGTTMPALTYLPDGPVISATQPPGYVEGILAAGLAHGFPEWYLHRLATFRTADAGSPE